MGPKSFERPSTVEVKLKEGVIAMADEPDEILKRFLAQPPEHGFNDDPPEVQPQGIGPRGSWWSRLNRFLFEKKPSQYSSIAPRRADGSRTSIFPFNGNGRGR